MIRILFPSVGRRTGGRSAVAAPLLVGLLLLPAGCDTSEPDDGGPVGTPGTPTIFQNIERGYALSPRGFPEDFSQIEAFFDEVQALGRASVQVNTLWRDNATGGAIPAVAQVAAAQDALRDVQLVVVFGWNEMDDWSNPETVQSFARMAASYAAAHKPDYLFLGNETDFDAERDPTAYAEWTAAYRTIRQEIKLRNPATLVGTVFNAEHFMGTGRFSGWTSPVTEAWAAHQPATIDVVGLTVYPFLGSATVADVPDTYLRPLFDLIGNKPIVVTETGWPADSFDGTSEGPVAWTPGEDAQVQFTTKLRTMLAGRDVRVVNWLFLYPLASGASPDVIRTFGSISAYGRDLSPRPLYDAWQAFNVDRE